MIVLSLLLTWGEIRVMGRVKMRKPFKICLLTKPGPEMCGSRVLGSVEMGAGQAVGRLVPCPHPHHQEMREINLEIEMIFFFPEWISPIFVYITSEQLIPTLYSIWKGSWPILRDFQVDFFFFSLFCCAVHWLAQHWQLLPVLSLDSPVPTAWQPSGKQDCSTTGCRLFS